MNLLRLGVARSGPLKSSRSAVREASCFPRLWSPSGSFKCSLLSGSPPPDHANACRSASQVNAGAGSAGRGSCAGGLGKTWAKQNYLKLGIPAGVVECHVHGGNWRWQLGVNPTNSSSQTHSSTMRGKGSGAGGEGGVAYDGIEKIGNREKRKKRKINDKGPPCWVKRREGANFECTTPFSRAIYHIPIPEIAFTFHAHT